MSNARPRLYGIPSSSNSVAISNDNNHNPSHGDGNGGGDDMLERVKNLEEKMSSIAIDVAILKDKVATKEDIQSSKVDLHKELNAQTWKIISALVIAVALAVLSKYFIK